MTITKYPIDANLNILPPRTFTDAEWAALSDARKTALAPDGGLALRDGYDPGAPSYSPNTHTLAKGRTVTADAVTITYTLTAKPLADVHAAYKAMLNTDAENVRLKYITDGVGQAMTYQEKQAQATAVLATTEAEANAMTAQERTALYPTLAASVGIEASTLWACAQLVMARYEAFADLSNVIETTRLTGIKAIDDATTVDGARQAYEAVTWTV